MSVRENALEALMKVSGGSKPKDAIEAVSGNTGLDRRDRALMMELVYGTIRWRLLLDHVLSGFLAKTPGNRTTENLRLALYQLLFTRVPGHAAVFEAVQLEKNGGNQGRPGLVNAVLRSFQRREEQVLKEMAALRDMANDPAAQDEKRLQAAAIAWSHPQWLLKKWARVMGVQEAFALAQSNNKIPPLTIRVKSGQKTEALEYLKKDFPDAAGTGFSPSGIKIAGGAVFEEVIKILPSCFAQDEAAQLTTFLLAPQPGERILDACAAPGGKSTHIAELMRDNGEIVAADISPERLERVRQNADRLGLKSVKPVQADAAGLEDGLGVFDRVILDAPCSALGTIRRNPDVKYRHTKKGLRELGAAQLRMLNSVSKAVKKDGIIVYCTCSTEPEEGEDVVDNFLKESSGAFLQDASSPAFMAELKAGRYFRTWPHRHGMDGFFMARLVRTR
ncbi:MAG: 16S rRNA (cytosine(967)-C(5))-methyltransferase RsmB [Actinomycetota bacterium]|nr:16S rRNA (cytosine(967)-C(5))-methyltransferase RsmB [Actinomycetota bacterium]